MNRFIDNDHRSLGQHGWLTGRRFTKDQRGDDWTPIKRTDFIPDDGGVYRELVETLKALRAELRILKDRRRVLGRSTSRTKRDQLSGAILNVRGRISSLYWEVQRVRDVRAYHDKAYRAAKNAERKRRKEENHNYTMSLHSMSYGAGDVLRPNGDVIFKDALVESVFGLGTPTKVWDANDELALTNKLGSQLQEHVDANLAVMAAEADRSLKMIGGQAKKLARSLQKAASGDLAGAARILGNTRNTSASLGSRQSRHENKWLAQGSPVRDRYMEYQLGIKPLIHDVGAAARALAWRLDRPVYQKVTARRTQKGQWDYDSGVTARYRGSIVVKGQLVAILKSQPNANHVLGATDIPSALWERVPFSWIADWFVPIGGYLQGLQNARTFGDVFTIKTVTTRTHREVLDSRHPQGWRIQADHPTFDHGVHVLRRCGAGLSVDLPTFKPLFHQDSSVRLRHTLEAIAVMHGFATKIDANRTRDLANEAREQRLVHIRKRGYKPQR
jgi:hypothetical protein